MMSRKLWLLAAVSLLSMIAFSSTSAMAADEKCKGTITTDRIRELLNDTLRKRS